MTIDIDIKLYKDIFSYCELNGLDFKKYVNDLLKKSFVVEKYGAKPEIFLTSEREEVKQTKKPTEANNILVTQKEKATEQPEQQSEGVVDMSENSCDKTEKSPEKKMRKLR